MTKLREVRIAKGFTQSELSNLSGVKLRVLQHYEQGARLVENAKLETITDLCESLNCKVSDIIESDELRERIDKYL